MNLFMLGLTNGSLILFLIGIIKSILIGLAQTICFSLCQCSCPLFHSFTLLLNRLTLPLHTPYMHWSMNTLVNLNMDFIDADAPHITSRQEYFSCINSEQVCPQPKFVLFTVSFWSLSGCKYRFLHDIVDQKWRMGTMCLIYQQ